MQGKFGLFIEYLWIGIALFSISVGAYQWNKNGFEEASVFIIMIFIAIFMYSFRRYLRKKTENNG